MPELLQAITGVSEGTQTAKPQTAEPQTAEPQTRLKS